MSFEKGSRRDDVNKIPWRSGLPSQGKCVTGFSIEASRTVEMVRIDSSRQ